MISESYDEGYRAGLADGMDDSLRQERSIAELDYALKGCMETLAKVRRSKSRLATAALAGWGIAWGIVVGMLVQNWFL